MFPGSVKQAGRFFSEARILELYSEIRDYLPKQRRKEFEKSWVVNNLLVGSRKRRRLEKKLRCTLPALIDITPTEKCNLNCLGCCALSYSRSVEMTADQIRSIIGQARELGIYLVGFLGGEPFARKDLFRVVEENNDMAFRKSTNGTMLDGETIEALKRCGNLVTFFSLEGFEEETDSWRGNGVYTHIMESMSKLKQERLLFGFSVLLHKNNVRAVVSTPFLAAMRDAGCKFGLFFPYGPAGDSARYELRLDENEISESFSSLGVLSKNYTMLLMKEGFTAPGDSGDYIAEKGCRAGVTVNITPEGNVEPCNCIQFFKDNILTSRLEDIYASPYFEEIRELHPEDRRECLVVARPREVMEVVKRHQVSETHKDAMSHLEKYVWNIERKEQRIPSRQTRPIDI
jgi:MoaA/NifB/PqqE/SkfB family radical SAM enzyme